MRGLIVEADPEADAALVRRVEKLYTSERPADRNVQELIERRRLIAAGVQRLRETDPAAYEAALLQLRRYDERMRRFGLRDRALDWTSSRTEAIRFLVRELPPAIVLVPLAILAVLVFAVPYVLTAVVGRRQTHSDTTATVKVVVGTIFYVAWVAAAAALTWSIFGVLGAAAAVLLLPVLGVAGLFAIEREQAAWRTARSWLSLRGTRPDTRQRLRRHRAELADVLDKVNATLAAHPSTVDRP
jgi:hypothetical protein